MVITSKTLMELLITKHGVLSAYGGKNIAEFIAESWGEYINNPTPRPLAKQVGDLMNAEYAKQFKDFGS